MQGTEEMDARRRALRALSVRAHFPRELVQKLVRRGIEEPLAKQVVQSLLKDHPGAFADVKHFVERKLQAGKSPRRIAQLLFQKGFSPAEALHYTRLEEER